MSTTSVVGIEQIGASSLYLPALFALQGSARWPLSASGLVAGLNGLLVSLIRGMLKYGIEPLDIEPEASIRLPRCCHQYSFKVRKTLKDFIILTD